MARLALTPKQWTNGMRGSEREMSVHAELTP